MNREVGSEYHIEGRSGSDDLVAYLSGFADKYMRDVKFLRCGRDALGFIADEIGGHIIYMPALCCDSMVLPFSVRGWDVEYYRVDRDLQADRAHLHELVSAHPDETPVVLVMNYYGLCDTTDIKLDIRENYHDAVIIEDVTHTVMTPETYVAPEGGQGAADYIIGSIRKWMGVPDGAIVMGPVMGSKMHDIPAHEDSDFTTLRYEALQTKRDYLADPGRPQDMKTRFRTQLSDAEDSLDNGADPYPVSQVSREILGAVDPEVMRRRRHDNFSLLRELLAADPLCGSAYEVFGAEVPVPECPFMLPVVMNIPWIRSAASCACGEAMTRDRFESKLAARGVYAPVLWPIDARAAQVSDEAAHFAHGMLAFYIDHRYDEDDMRYVAEQFIGELHAILDDELPLYGMKD